MLKTPFVGKVAEFLTNSGPLSLITMSRFPCLPNWNLSFSITVLTFVSWRCPISWKLENKSTASRYSWPSMVFRSVPTSNSVLLIKPFVWWCSCSVAVMVCFMLILSKGACVTRSLTFLSAISCSCCHCHGTTLHVNCCIGSNTSASWNRNFTR